MAKRPVPDVSYIREALDYDPVTGLLRWNARPLSHFRSTKSRTQEWSRNWWNARFAGTAAGWVDHNGYIAVEVNRRTFPGHHLAWVISTGQWPVDELDHENLCRADNRLANLREASSEENGRNRRRYRNNSSGFKGVSYHKATNRWCAVYQTTGTQTWLGLFDTREAAHAAYCQAASIAHGEFFNSGT